jgi:hypothetical protein
MMKKMMMMILTASQVEEDFLEMTDEKLLMVMEMETVMTTKMQEKPSGEQKVDPHFHHRHHTMSNSNMQEILPIMELTVVLIEFCLLFQ